MRNRHELCIAGVLEDSVCHTSSGWRPILKLCGHSHSCHSSHSSFLHLRDLFCWYLLGDFLRLVLLVELVLHDGVVLPSVLHNDLGLHQLEVVKVEVAPSRETWKKDV